MILPYIIQQIIIDIAINICMNNLNKGFKLFTSSAKPRKKDEKLIISKKNNIYFFLLFYPWSQFPNIFDPKFGFYTSKPPVGHPHMAGNKEFQNCRKASQGTIACLQADDTSKIRPGPNLR